MSDYSFTTILPVSEGEGSLQVISRLAPTTYTFNPSTQEWKLRFENQHACTGSKASFSEEFTDDSEGPYGHIPCYFVIGPREKDYRFDRDEKVFDLSDPGITHVLFEDGKFAEITMRGFNAIDVRGDENLQVGTGLHATYTFD